MGKTDKVAVLHNAGCLRPITLELVQQGIAECKDGCTAIYSNFGLRHQYISLLIYAHRFRGMKLVDGESVVEVDGIPWFTRGDEHQRQIKFISGNYLQAVLADISDIR